MLKPTLIAGLVLLSLAPGAVAAQMERATTPPSPLAGTWTLTAADDLLADGTRVPAYGAEPKGILIIDAEGRYSLQIYRTGRLRFAAGDKRRGTPEEFADATLGMSAHTGHCSIDPSDNRLVFRIESASYPNWEGTVQRRVFRLSGDTLTWQVPPSASGATPISEWRRLR
jgi:hypothetical protein